MMVTPRNATSQCPNSTEVAWKNKSWGVPSAAAQHSQQNFNESQYAYAEYKLKYAYLYNVKSSSRNISMISSS